jgi:putative transposase
MPYTMKIIKTFQYYLKTNITTKNQLNKTLEGCNFVYNELLKDKIKRDKNKEKQLSLSNQSKFLTKLRKENDFLKTINRAVLNETVFRVNQTWTNYLRHKQLELQKGYPRIKPLNRYNSFTCLYGYRDWKLEENKLILSQGRGNRTEKDKRSSKKITTKIILHRPIERKIVNLIIKRKNNRWYAGFVCEIETQPRIETNQYIGIDLNLKKKDFITLSNGIKFEHPQNHKKLEKKLVKSQQELTKKQKGSKNREKARMLYSKKWEKVVNQNKFTYHLIAREFEKYDGIAREDLKIENMRKNRKLAKAIWRSSWGTFNKILAHRVEDTGGQVVKVSPYNTTQRCSECGELTKEKLTLKNRVFYCWNCQFTLDRDVNSARNVLDKAIENNGFGVNLCRDANGLAFKQEV